jgi:cytochrome c-type biogenesis protein CcmH/NrfF
VTVRRLLALIAVGAGGAALAGVPGRAIARSRVSFTEAQQTFMCTICHEPLNEAHSPEAFQENGYLRQLIARGDTLAEIKHNMVVQFGTAVLADPPKHGFALLVVIIPVAVIVLGLLTLIYTIPLWRRRAAQAAARPHAEVPAISREDAQRLDADLTRQK